MGILVYTYTSSYYFRCGVIKCKKTVNRLDIYTYIVRIIYIKVLFMKTMLLLCVLLYIHKV